MTTAMKDRDGREIGPGGTAAVALAVEKGTARGGSALAHPIGSDEREAVLRKGGTTGGAVQTKGAGRGVVPMIVRENTVTAIDHGLLKGAGKGVVPMIARRTAVVAIDHGLLRGAGRGVVPMIARKSAAVAIDHGLLKGAERGVVLMTARRTAVVAIDHGLLKGTERGVVLMTARRSAVVAIDHSLLKGAGRGVVPMIVTGSTVVAVTANDHAPLSEGGRIPTVIGRAEVVAHGNVTRLVTVCQAAETRPGR